MKKLLVCFMILVMALSFTACSNSADNAEQTTKAQVINDFSQLDASKFRGGLSGDGYFLVLYEGVIDEAVMGGTLTADSGEQLTLDESTIVKNPDGHSLLFFEQLKAQAGDTVKLTLEKEGFTPLVLNITVEG